MYKNYTAFRCGKPFHVKSKIFLIMKLSFLILLATFMQVSASSMAQKISLDKNNMTLLDALTAIKDQSGYSILYDEELLLKAENVNIHVKNATLQDALKQCFYKQPFSYTINNHSILITPKLFATAATVKAAPIQVSGKVTDEKGLPLPGVTVRLKGTDVSTSTDNNGIYNIKLPDGDGLLVFTFMGFTAQEVPVKNTKKIDVTLKEAAIGLSDVVVVGYGQQKKASLIGAISTVNVEELKQPVANLSNALAGRIAGIIGVQRSGQPGYDNSDIYIRGISTFTNSRPLVLVDGIEREFNNVDPEDIASFSILKDASATAVYGVRGANGVILIQTKKGKIGRPLINVQYDQGITQFTKIPKFADGVTYLQIANEASLSSNPNGGLRYSQERIDKTASGEDPDLYPNVDWFKYLFNKTGQNRRARVNANGGSQNAQYYLSIGYYDENGLYKTDQLAEYNSAIKFTRYNFTSNLTLNITKSTKVDFGASGWLSNGNYPGTSVDAIWGSAYLLPPVVIPPVYSNGLHSQITSGDVFNPYNQLTQSGYVNEFKSQLWSNIRLTQDLGFWLKGLSATAMFSFDNLNSHNISRTKTVDAFIATGRDEEGNLITKRTATGTSFLGYNRTNGGSRQFYTEAAINYNNTFGTKHNVSGLILYNQQDRVDAFAGDFIGSIPYRYMGLAGRATYAYNNRYLAEANFGYNGSETFAPSKRFGFFPSFGVGWVISEESFFKPLASTFQFLKLRYSWGVVGNSAIGGRRFGYISTVGGGNGNYDYGSGNSVHTINGYDIDEYAVNVSWERATKQNLGIEVKMLNNAISLVADVFQENRTGIFRERGDVPDYAGVRNLPDANLGVIHNRGFDATLDLNKQLGSDWHLGLRGNFTWTRAIVINDANAPWPYPWQQRIGRKFDKRFGYTALGLFTSDEDVANSPYQTGTNKAGDIKYKDLNADGKIDTYDQGPIGYGATPEIVYGFGPTITWKGFSLAAWFKGISNVDISLSGDGFQPFSQGGERGNLLAEITDHWTPGSTNPRPFYPRLTYGNDNMNFENSTWWVKSGAFMRLQTLQLNYDFNGAKWLAGTGMSNLSIYFMGYNLWTVSGFKLWDVELGNGRGSQYPLLKTYNVGIKCTFK
jgi:TonB-linked SusC/RagA family outer membrane protein